MESGQVLWSQEVASYEAPGADWTALYVTSISGDLVALNRSSGAMLWTQDVLHQRGVTAPAASGSSIVVGDYEGYIHWLNAATGALEARARVDDAAIVGRPVAAGDLVVFQTESGRLAAYRAKRPDAG